MKFSELDGVSYVQWRGSPSKIEANVDPNSKEDEENYSKYQGCRYFYDHVLDRLVNGVFLALKNDSPASFWFKEDIPEIGEK